MATRSGAYVVATIQMTREDLAQLQAGTLPCQAVWKFSRDSKAITASQQLLAASEAKVACGTDCGMFPFSHGILEFQAMVEAGLSPPPASISSCAPEQCTAIQDRAWPPSGRRARADGGGRDRACRHVCREQLS
jgi:hypothetical protein